MLSRDEPTHLEPGGEGGRRGADHDGLVAEDHSRRPSLTAPAVVVEVPQAGAESVVGGIGARAVVQTEEAAVLSAEGDHQLSRAEGALVHREAEDQVGEGLLGAAGSGDEAIDRDDAMGMMTALWSEHPSTLEKSPDHG